MTNFSDIKNAVVNFKKNPSGRDASQGYQVERLKNQGQNNETLLVSQEKGDKYVARLRAVLGVFTFPMHRDEFYASTLARLNNIPTPEILYVEPLEESILLGGSPSLSVQRFIDPDNLEDNAVTWKEIGRIASRINQIDSSTVSGDLRQSYLYEKIEQFRLNEKRIRNFSSTLPKGDTFKPILSQMNDTALKSQWEPVLLHYDIRPANFIKDRDTKNLKILDWGSACRGPWFLETARAIASVRSQDNLEGFIQGYVEGDNSVTRKQILTHSIPFSLAIVYSEIYKSGKLNLDYIGKARKHARLLVKLFTEL